MSGTHARAAGLVAALSVGLAGRIAQADDPDRTTAPDGGQAADETRTSRHVAESQVHFAFDSAELSDEGRVELGKAADWIRQQKTGLILIEGHADKVGSEPYNKDLAQRRAETARRYLMARGVSAEQIRILSYGEGLPAEKTEDSSRLNRRIVLMAVQKEPIIENTVTRDVVTVPVEKRVFVDRVVEVPAPARRPLGLEVLVGGGVTGFIDDHTNDVTDVGGMWTARVVGRSRNLVGFEAAYVGSAQDIDALGVDANATVLGSGVEGNVRLNVIRGARLQPYVFAGLGWTHYNVTNTDVNTSSIDATDDVLHLPAGAGMGLQLTPRVMVDVRATVRGAVGDGMFDGGTETSDGMESLSSVAQLGFAF